MIKKIVICFVCLGVFPLSYSFACNENIPSYYYTWSNGDVYFWPDSNNTWTQYLLSWVDKNTRTMVWGNYKYNWYSKDKNYIYKWRTIVVWADSETYHQMTWGGFRVDKNSVYFQEKSISGVKPNSFHFLNSLQLFAFSLKNNKDSKYIIYAHSLYEDDNSYWFVYISEDRSKDNCSNPQLLYIKLPKNLSNRLFIKRFLSFISMEGNGSASFLVKMWRIFWWKVAISWNINE